MKLALYDPSGQHPIHAETVYDPIANRAEYLVFDRSTQTILGRQDELTWPLDQVTYRPYNGGFDGGPNNLLALEVVRLPSDATDYGEDDDLFMSVQGFIATYMHLPNERDYKIAATYVFLTWIGDAFPSLPYLRVRGDLGGGKSRFLKTVGAISYCPIFASGAATVSPLYRILQVLRRGTFILDEMDLGNGTGQGNPEAMEIVKILNLGYEKGTAVLRTAKDSPGMETEAFDTFGPKVLASRNLFPDAATESRCLTIPLPVENPPENIPLNLGRGFWNDAAMLRNQLLLWRLRNFRIYTDMANISLINTAPRTRMLIAPMTMVFNGSTQTDLHSVLLEFARDMDREVQTNRSLDWEAEALRHILELIEARPALISGGELTDTIAIPTDELLARINEERESVHEGKMENKRHLHETLRVRLSLKVDRFGKGNKYALLTTRQQINDIASRFGLIDLETAPEPGSNDNPYLESPPEPPED
jgi:hypothetical protein